MNYRYFGKTGIKVSILGLGTMHLPMEKINGKSFLKEEKELTKLIREAIEYGINFIDTGYHYCEEQSEIIVGKAIKGLRDKVYLSTKIPTWEVKKPSDYRVFLKEQLKKLDVDYIDFYHFHGLNEIVFKNVVLKYDLLKEAQKAKDEGIIRYISFSFHDSTDIMKEIIDTGIFDSVLCQYNILDTTLEDAIEYASLKGLGVAIMGPLGGGRVISMGASNTFVKENIDFAELGLKFVFSNKNISTALSAMVTLKMLKENIKTASNSFKMKTEELNLIEKILTEQKNKELIPCTSCNYCMPCPNHVFISGIFKNFNYYRLTGNKSMVAKIYNEIDLEYSDYSKADKCAECGECEEKCPQKIDIINKLKEIHELFSKN